MLQPGEFYHVFNQGNNRQKIFLEPDNYRFFLGKVHEHLTPTADILAYCLMPNHFHFLVSTTAESCIRVKVGPIHLTKLSNAFRVIQSTYTQAINKRFTRSGSLFRQKAKMNFLADAKDVLVCMKYIHDNPVKAGITKDSRDYMFSSIHEYTETDNVHLCKTAIARTAAMSDGFDLSAFLPGKPV